MDEGNSNDIFPVLNLIIKTDSRALHGKIPVQLKIGGAEMFKRNLYLFIWTVGFFILIFLANRSFGYFDNKYNETMNYAYTLWSWGTIPILVGIYFSLYRGIPKVMTVNKSQLITLVLSFAVVAYPFLAFYLELSGLAFIYNGLYNYNGYYLVAFLLGFSLINSFFEFKSE